MRPPLFTLAYLYDPEGRPHVVFGWARYGVLIPTVTPTHGSVDRAAHTITDCLAVPGYRFEPKVPELEGLPATPTTEQLTGAFVKAMARIDTEYR
jgi:hypothetical protein